MIPGLILSYLLRLNQTFDLKYKQTPGNRGGWAPLELRFYRVKIFKMDKISFSLLFGPPLGKNRSQGPAYFKYLHIIINYIT